MHSSIWGDFLHKLWQKLKLFLQVLLNRILTNSKSPDNTTLSPMYLVLTVTTIFTIHLFTSRWMYFYMIYGTYQQIMELILLVITSIAFAQLCTRTQIQSHLVQERLIALLV